MTPAETATILRQFNKWRRGDEDIPQFDPREIGEAIDAAVEMIDRLEAAETELAELRSSMKFRTSLIGRTEAERDALRAKIARMEQQEPVFWWRPCSDGAYEGPLHNNSIERVRKQSGAWSPLYALPGAQPAPSVPEGWIQRGVAELEAIRSRQDDDTLLDDRTLIERIGKAMLEAAPEAKP